MYPVRWNPVESSDLEDFRQCISRPYLSDRFVGEPDFSLFMHRTQQQQQQQQQQP
jgi:hypothetical protein